MNRRSTTLFDLAGRTLAQGNPLNQRTTTIYDAAGQAVGSIDPLNRRSTTLYDLAGRTLARGNPLSQRTTTVYDAAGESIASIDPRGYRVSMAYDPAGRQTALTNPNGGRTTFGYDAAGQLSYQADPLSRRTSFAYDPAGRRVLVYDPRGLRLTSVYDPAGRRVTEQLPNPVRNTFAYDATGRRVLLSDATGRTTTAYDGKGRTLAVNQPPGKRVSYAYDSADRRRYLTDPDGGRTTYLHDAAGQLTSVNAPNVGRTTLLYDAAGREAGRLLGTGGRVTTTFDAAGQTGTVNTTRQGIAVNRFTYSYDPAGRRTLARAADGTRTSYAYDPAGQLTSERRSGGLYPANATFTYDPAGNRTALNDSGVRTTSTYDGANQHLSDTGPSGQTLYSYDQAGNRTQADGPGGMAFYGWDAKGRLTLAEPVSGAVTMAYGGDGRRHSRQVQGTPTRFVYDFEKVLQETDGGGDTQKQYASTEEEYGKLLGAYGGGQAQFYAPDALGNTDALLSAGGSLQAQYAYRAFGLNLQTEETGGSTQQTWVGQQGYYDEQDETGLYFLRARHYDPQSARFLGADPDGFGAGDANLYRYCGNDPVNRTDPSGRGCDLVDFQCQGRATLDRLQRGGLEAVGAVTAVGQSVQSGVTRAAGYVRAGAVQVGSSVNQAAGYVRAGVNQGVQWTQQGAQWTQQAWQQQLGYVRAGLNYSWQLTSQGWQYVVDRSLEALNYLLWSGGIDPASFWQIFSQFGNVAGRLLTSAVSLATKLLNGTAAGLKSFFNNILKNLANVLLKWLFGDLEFNWELVPARVTDWRGWVGFFADLVGATWDKILGAVQGVFAQEIALIVDLYQKVAGFVEKGWQGLVDWGRQTWAEVQAKLDFNELRDMLVKKALEGALAAAVDAAVQWALRLIPTGYTQVVAALQAVYNLLRWAYNNWQRLVALYNSFVEGFQALLGEGGEAKVAQLVEGGLVKAAVLGLDLIARQFGLGSIPQSSRNLFNTVNGWVPRQVAALLGKLKQYLLGLLTRLWAGLWGRQAWKAGGKTHQLWVDYQSGRVLTSSSPSRDVKEELDELRKRARARKKARALGLIEQAQGVWAKADRQVKQAAKAAKAKPAKGKPGKNGASPTAVVSKDAPEIQEGAKRLAGMLQEIQQLVGGCPVKTGCFVAGTGVWVVGGRVAIEALGLGDAVRTREGADWAGGPWGPGDEWRLRAVWLRLAKEGGGCVVVGLLREAGWLGGAGVGGEVRLDLEEQGAVGRAVVEAVLPCPPLPARREGYAVVTGVFRHESAGVCDLRVEGEGVIGVTAGHPFWSVDRGAWVSAGLLREGERLLGEGGGTPRVAGVGLRAGVEPVYNIEVDGDHCYRVGEQGLLVHNASAEKPDYRIESTGRGGWALFSLNPIRRIAKDPINGTEIRGDDEEAVRRELRQFRAAHPSSPFPDADSVAAREPGRRESKTGERRKHVRQNPKPARDCGRWLLRE